METLVTFLLGLLGGYVLGPLLQRRIELAHRRRRLSRNGLVDLQSLMTSIEEALPQLAAVTEPRAADDLVNTPSGCDLSGPTIELAEYLSCIDEPELQRVLILLFDDFQKLSQISAESKALFAWLLQHPDEWSSAAGKEAQASFTRERSEAKEALQRLLSYCAEACARLIETGDSPSNELENFVQKHYGLTKNQISLRAAYYRLSNVRTPFDRQNRYALYHWGPEDGTATTAFLGIRIGGQWFVVPARTEVALPSESQVEEVKVTYDKGETWCAIPKSEVEHLPLQRHCADELTISNLLLMPPGGGGKP